MADIIQTIVEVQKPATEGVQSQSQTDKLLRLSALIELWLRLDNPFVARDVQSQFTGIFGVKREGVLSRALARMQTHAASLEAAVRDRTNDLRRENAACEAILLEMLPRYLLRHTIFH